MKHREAYSVEISPAKVVGDTVVSKVTFAYPRDEAFEHFVKATAAFVFRVPTKEPNP